MTISIRQSTVQSIDSSSEPAGFTDLDSAFQYVNPAAAAVFGVAHHLDMIGASYADMPCGAAEFASTFITQDQHIIETRQTLHTLEIHPYANDAWHVFVLTSKPYIDDHDRVLGKTFHARDITAPYSLSLSAQLAQWSGSHENSYTLANVAGRNLTPREEEVLFLIIRGKTAKLAAASLGLSPRTVQQHIDMLKAKFNVSTKGELIDMAIAAGYLNQIPISLFSKQLSIVLAIR